MDEAGADRGQIAVFLLDDHEIVRRGVRDVLEADPLQETWALLPQGNGKTTLMAQWAQRTESRVAWLSCDDADNDPVVLLSALAIALSRIGPVDPAIFSALASSGADITVVPRFVAAVASVPAAITPCARRSASSTGIPRSRNCSST